MTALMNDHNGPQETNRVHYNKKDATWVIRPPLNYKHDSSLPPNKATNFSQMQYARARANEQTDYWVLLAKAEAHVRRSLGTDHSSHVRERQQKRSAAQKARLLKAAANNKVITSSTLIEDGKGVVPQMSREMAQHGNQRTIDLSPPNRRPTCKLHMSLAFQFLNSQSILGLAA